MASRRCSGGVGVGGCPSNAVLSSIPPAAVPVSPSDTDELLRPETPPPPPPLMLDDIEPAREPPADVLPNGPALSGPPEAAADADADAAPMVGIWC